MASLALVVALLASLGAGFGAKLDSDFLKENLVQSGENKPIDISLPKYDVGEDIAYLKRLITDEDLTEDGFRNGMTRLTSLFAKHEVAHLMQYMNGYGYDVETQLSRSGTKMMGDAKGFIEELMERNNMTYDRFLNYLNNYVRENTHFWLFANNIDGYEELAIGEKANVSKSKFDPKRPTVILIHGWVNAGDNFYSQSMIDAYKKYGDYNIISVDWSKLSYTFYTMSRMSVNFIGPYVSQLIDHLVEKEGAKLDDIHILGHSLGAHVAGIAGKFVQSGKVGRITGFDPASPLFGDDEKFRLHASDAQFVDVIHSSLLGMQDRLGHADFYPNGGGPLQPGCGVNIGVCPHRRAYEYYIESMEPRTMGFLAYPCDSWLAFEEGNCTQNPASLSANMERGFRGKFFFRTAEDSPFALGARTLERQPSSEIKRPPTKKPPKKPNNIWDRFNLLPFIRK